MQNLACSGSGGVRGAFPVRPKVPARSLPTVRSRLLLCFVVATLAVMGVRIAPADAQAGEGASRGIGIRVNLPKDRVSAPDPSLVSLDNPERAAIVRHEVTAGVEPQSGRIEAVDRITIVHAPGTPGAEPTSFLLWQDLEVVGVDSEPAVAVTPLERMKARALWHRPPYAELEGYAKTRQYELRLQNSAGTWPETLDVLVRYTGTIVDSLQPPEAAYARSFETSAGLIVAEGVFLAGSSFWIPSRPDDIFGFELVAQSPLGWRVVSQGELERSDERDGRRTDHWICRHPMNEIYLVAGPWEEHQLRHGDVLAQTFTYASTDSALYNRYLRGTRRYLDLYQARIGPYPFEKFAMVENFWQTGYGMPSFTLLGDRVIRLPFILDTSYGHEILHNWWGNGVFVNAEQGNWCEGLTTYGADYLYKELEDEAAGREYRWNALKGYLDYVSAGEDIPLTEFRERHDFATQAIGYGKAMMVFHQVRRELGDAAFTKALQSFYRDHLFRRASWMDLMRSFAGAHPKLAPGERDAWAEAVHAQWIARTGAPVLRLADAGIAPRDGDGSWHTVLDLTQDEASAPFQVRVPVRILGAESAVLDTVLVLARAELRADVRTPFEPRRVEIDPDFDVLRRLHREEIPASLSQVLGADSVVIVIASGLSPDLEEACREVAESWSTDHRAKILGEEEIGPDLMAPAVWFLGLGPAARIRVAARPDVLPPAGDSPWIVAGSEFSDATGAVVTGPLDGGESAWGCLASTDPATMRAMGRKVPHYGKYSYLLFAGEQNIGKGIWPVGQSPLIHDFTAVRSESTGR